MTIKMSTPRTEEPREVWRWRELVKDNINELIDSIGGGSVTLDTTNFNNNLSSSDNTLQKMADTVDDLNLGEDNTASNLGSGSGVFAQKSSLDLEFKSLADGNNIDLTASSTEITIDMTPAGADTQIQYNNGGVLGADANFNWDDTNEYLGIGLTTPTACLHIDPAANSDVVIYGQCATAHTGDLLHLEVDPNNVEFKVLADGTVQSFADGSDDVGIKYEIKDEAMSGNPTDASNPTILRAVGALTNSPSRQCLGGDFLINCNLTSGTQSNPIIGGKFKTSNRTTGSARCNQMYGGFFEVENNATSSSATTNAYIGYFNFLGVDTKTTTFTNLWGIRIGGDVEDGTVTTLRGIEVEDFALDTGAITTAYGIELEEQSNATTNHQIFSHGGKSTLKTGGASTTALIIEGDASQTADPFQIEKGSGTLKFAVGANGELRLMADQTSDTAPTDDTSIKKLTLQKLASAPTNAAYVAFSNNPGTDVFYLVLEEG